MTNIRNKNISESYTMQWHYTYIQGMSEPHVQTLRGGTKHK